MTDPLHRVLDQIRLALRRGDYAALDALARQLEAGLPDCRALPPQALHHLRAEAERTATCLAAARNGMRAAQRRLADIRAGGAGLATYDRAGRIERGARPATREKRL